MESIFEATTDRRSNERRRAGFSWSSFYAGVLVAMAMMLVAYHLLPRGGLAGRQGKMPAMAVTPATVHQGDAQAPAEQAAEARRLRGYEKRINAKQLAANIEDASPDTEVRSMALARLRSRGNAPLNAFDRDDAITALMDRTGKTPEEAQILVDSWITRGPGVTPVADAQH